MRTLKSILLAGAMLLATPAFFSSCQEDGTLLKYGVEVTVTNDFTQVVEAINKGTLKNEQAIAQLAAAIDKMNVDQQAKLQAIKDVINSANATLYTKLAAIEAAMKAQTITLEGKLAFIVEAMKAQTLSFEQKCDAIVAAIKGMPDYSEKLQAIEKAINAMPDYTSKLEAIEKVLTSQTLELANKLAAIEAIMKDQSILLNDRIVALEKAIKALPDYTEQLEAVKTAITALPDYSSKLEAIETALNSQTLKLAEKIVFIQGALADQTVAMEKKMDLIKNILANQNTTLENKLAAIAAAMKEQTIALTEKMKLIESVMKDQKTAFETKVDIFTGAVKNLPNYEDILEAIKTAIINTNPNEQLKFLQDVLDKYCSDELIYPDNPLSYKGKLYYIIAEIEDTMRYMTYKDDKFKAIRKAIEKLAGENAKLDGILDNMTKIVEAIKAGNTSEKEGWAEIAKQLELLKAAAGIGGSTDKVEYVDLGLPSGNLWAKCNLGASTPEAYGDYYAWGETKPKKEYTYPNHKWYKEGAPSLGFTKYNNEDGKLTLEDEDDAVIQKLGNGWRTPTLADFRELTNQKYTTIEKTTLNGVAGYQITSKKNGKSIFIPFAGFKNDKPQTREISSSEEVAICMTNQRRIDDQVFNCWTFAFEQDRIRRYGKRRPDGISIRPVKGPGVPVPNNCVDLGLASGVLWAKYNIGTTEPTQPGNYYAWGELSTKKEYYSTNYKHFGKHGVIKYNEKDGKTVLELGDDVARTNLGAGYRIPTKADWEELLEDCKWEAVTVSLPIELDPSQKKSIARWKVTGPNGNSIVLPMTGGFKADGWGVMPDYDTYYTTANLYPADKQLDEDKYQEAVVLTWPMYAEETASGGIEEPSLGATYRDFGVVVRPVFDLYSNK